MSKPVLYDKSKWDTSLGLDYSGSPVPLAPYGDARYKHHDFPPLFKNMELIGHTDMEGHGDCMQVVKEGDYVFQCNNLSSGFSVVNVKDPTDPQFETFVPTGNVHTWSTKCRVVNHILIVNNEWKFFEPYKYYLSSEGNPHDSGPREPVQSGIKVYDVSKPAEPKLLSFFKTGKWSRNGGGVGCHRFWFDGHYAYISAEMPGYYGNIMMIVDVSDPKNPEEISRFWLPGQYTAGGERPSWDTHTRCRIQLHHPIVQGDRAYTAWFGLGGAIVDISNIRRPTLVTHFNYDMGGQNHTFFPIRNRQFAVFVSEYSHAWMLDISDERYPRVIAMFPPQPRELLERGVGWKWGPSLHNVHENPPGSDVHKSDTRLYTACGPGGLRIYDISDPYRIEELGYYVPGTPKVYFDPRGPEHQGVGTGVDVSDVFVDKKGTIYCGSYNGGLDILRFTG
jgi:hypothetical protein